MEEENIDEKVPHHLISHHTKWFKITAMIAVIIMLAVIIISPKNCLGRSSANTIVEEQLPDPQNTPANMVADINRLDSILIYKMLFNKEKYISGRKYFGNFKKGEEYTIIENGKTIDTVKIRKDGYVDSRAIPISAGTKTIQFVMKGSSNTVGELSFEINPAHTFYYENIMFTQTGVLELTSDGVKTIPPFNGTVEENILNLVSVKELEFNPYSETIRAQRFFDGTFNINKKYALFLNGKFLFTLEPVAKEYIVQSGQLDLREGKNTYTIIDFNDVKKVIDRLHVTLIEELTLDDLPDDIVLGELTLDLNPIEVAFLQDKYLYDYPHFSNRGPFVTYGNVYDRTILESPRFEMPVLDEKNKLKGAFGYRFPSGEMKNKLRLVLIGDFVVGELYSLFRDGKWVGDSLAYSDEYLAFSFNLLKEGNTKIQLVAHNAYVKAGNKMPDANVNKITLNYDSTQFKDTQAFLFTHNGTQEITTYDYSKVK